MRRSKKFTVDNLDRFLRVIYKEADILELMILSPRIGSSRSFGFEERVRQATAAFWLERSDSPHCKASYRELVVSKYLQCYPRDYSEDEVEVLLDAQLETLSSAWGIGRKSSRDAKRTNALQLILKAASSLLVCRNERLVVRQGCLLEWNGVADKIDQNVLFAAYDLLSGRNEGGHACVRYGDKRLERILSRGYAETHAHLNGSGYSPEINWYCFLWLSAHHISERDCALRGYVESRWPGFSKDRIEGIILVFKKLPVLRGLLQAYARVLSGAELRDGAVQAPNELKLIEQISKMMGQLLYVRDEETLELLLEDPRFVRVMGSAASEIPLEVFDDPSECFYFEQRFHRMMLSVLPALFNLPAGIYAYNVYIAAITQFKSGMLHDNLLMGFSRFSASETQKEVFLDHVPGAKRLLYRSVFDRYYRGEGVRLVELRIAPKKRARFISLVNELDDANKWAYDKSCQRGERPCKIEYRLVAHFIKTKTFPSKEFGVARKENDAHNADCCLADIETIFDLSAASRDYVSKLVAIDTANFELHTRPETYASVFRKFSSEIAALHETGKTYHVGEDFLTLCNGLRAIDEVLEFLEFAEGDRLGHATALGLDVQEYYQRKRFYITCPLEEHVDDLVWLHQMIVRHKSREAEVLAYLEDEYEKYATKLYSPGALDAIPSLRQHWKAYCLRGNSPDLYINPAYPTAMSPGCKTKKSSSHNAALADMDRGARELYSRYHFDGRLKEAGALPMVIKVDGEYVRAVALAQRLLLKKVHEKGIGIETNPSSNRKISSVHRYIDLPLFSFNCRGLTSLEEKRMRGICNIPVTINSDDCGIFQTDLAMEYALIAEALKKEGFDHESVYEYIDHLRKLSLDQCFFSAMRNEGLSEV